MMKKFGAVIFAAFIFTLEVGAQSAGVKVWVMPTEQKNLATAEAAWLPEAVHNALRANITNYSGLVVAEENADRLARIQARSYNENISESDAVRMGKQIGANHVIRSTITKTGKTYSLNVIFQALEGGAHLAESNKTASAPENLYAVPGCAVNEATIEILDRLDSRFGTALSSYNTRVLMKGISDLSSEEEKKYNEDEEKRLEQIIKNLNKEIDSAMLSKNPDAATQKTQLEFRLKQEEERLRQAKEKQKRLEKEAEDRHKELEEEKYRSTMQKERIRAQQDSIEKKISELRKQKVDSSSVMQQIASIEAKKKAMLDLRKQSSTELNKIRKDEEDEIAKKSESIMNAPLRTTQKDSSGKMLKDVEDARRGKVYEETLKIRDEYDKFISKTKKDYDDAEKDLLDQINEQYEILGKVRTADNIVTKDLSLSVNRFLGEEKAWDSKATLVSGGVELFSYFFRISYKVLAGREPDVLSDEYADDVDAYNSLFSKGYKPVQAILTYKVEPAAENKPSQYVFTFSKIELVRTEDGKPLLTITLNKVVTRKMFDDVYDIRSEKMKDDERIRTAMELAKEQEKLAREQEKLAREQEKLAREQEEKAKEQEKKEKEIAKKEKYSSYTEQYDQKHGDFGSLSGIGGGVSVGTDGKVCGEFWLDVPMGNNYSFVSVGLGAIPPPTSLINYVDGMYFLDVGLGVNKRLLFLFASNLFANVSIGGCFGPFLDGYGFIDDDVYHTFAGYFLMRATAGVEIPLYFAWLNARLSGSAFWAIGGGMGAYVNLGVTISLFKTHIFMD